MNGKKIVILFYCLLVLAFSFTLQPSSAFTPYQSGRTAISLQSNSQTRNFQQQEQIFSFNPLRKYSNSAEVILTIAGFHLNSSYSQKPAVSMLSVASLEGKMQNGQELKIKTKNVGGIVRLQINYLIMEHEFMQEMGLLLWDNQNKNTLQQVVSQMFLSVEQELIQNEQPKLKNQKSEQSKIVQPAKEIQIVQLLSTLALRQGQILELLDLRIIIHQEKMLVKVGIPPEAYLQGTPLVYKLLMTKSIESIPSSVQKYLKIVDQIEYISSRRSLILQNAEKEEGLILGLNGLKSKCPFLSNLQYQFADSTHKISATSTHSQREQCTYTIHFVGLQLVTQTKVENFPARFLATPCTGNTYYGLNNYMSLATVSQPSAWYQCPWWLSWWCQPNCKPCPIGCSACSSLNCASMHVSCSSCSAGFTKISTGNCSGQTYCGCPNGTYSDVSQTCKNCTAIIPNCQSCSSTFYVGTYCASCNTGYYPTYVGATSGYARGCAACSAGCKNCTSSASCLTCINNLVVINSVCTCNTSQSSYYNSNTSSCTSCSTAITNCLNCSLSGLSTSCTQCKTGNYLDSTNKTCIACSTYCSVCTASACTTCVSTTLTISGTNCVCTSPLFLNTSSSPPSCSACTNFQPNCQTCNSSSGSVLCQTCNPSFYPSPAPGPGICQACVANCLSCVDNSSCTTCKTNFTYNPAIFACECSSGFVAYGANSCIQCAYLIPGCQSCGPNGLYCATCANPYYNSTLNGSTCTLCPQGCTSCTSPGTGACGGCITDYQLIGSNCVCTNCSDCATNTSMAFCSSCAGTTCYSCSIGYYFNSTNNNCTACPSACSSCTSATSCTTCTSPFIYISPDCVCNNALLYYYNPGTQSCTTSCSSIITNCTSCTGQVSPGSVSSTTCTACTTGTYLFNSTTCSLCPSTCLQCSSATNCSSCPPSFYIINGICNCDTNSQYFLNTSSNTCQFCNTMLPNCTICQVNTSTASNVGCYECDLGYYINAADSCTLCPKACVTCTSPTACTSCINTYSMINGSCICDASKQLYDTGSQCQPCYTFVRYCTQCVYSGIVTCASGSCIAGTYLNSPSNTSCLLCPGNCNQCDSTGCITCIQGFLPVSGVCVFTNDCSNYAGVDPNCASCNTTNTTNSSSTICEGCLTGFYLVDNITCLPCSSTCQSCSSYSVCLVCSPTFTYIDGVCTCDALQNQVLSSSKCVSCGSLLTNCLACNSTAVPVACSACLPTYYLNGSGICVSCLLGCTTCYQNNSCTDCKPGFTFNLTALTCTDSTFCNSTSYYNGAVCTFCPQGCSSCVDSLTCIACDSTYSLIDGICQCDALQSMFYSPQTLTCNQCGNYNSSQYGTNFTLNCLTCVNTNNYTSAGFQCLICKTGYYISWGLCFPCEEGCNDCSGINNCIKCTAPQYILNSTGGCECNEMINYFQNNTHCDLCTLQNCTICLSISVCQNCTPGSFVNSTTQECQPQICGNSRREGVQECDDGNRIDGDGCNFYCNFEPYFVCTNLVQGELTVCQSQSNKFKLQLVQQIVSCNKITLKLLNVGSQSISHCDISNLMPSYEFPSTTFQSHSNEDKYITYEFSYDQTIQNETFNLIFDPTTLCIANSLSFPPFNISTLVSPTNNQLALYYEQSLCTKQTTAQNVVNTIKYVSYATLALSALPSKIVGLQLFGVLQLSYLSVGSMDNVNMLLEPLSSLGSVNGYQLNLGSDRVSSRLLQFTPERINAIDYKANFLRNCNAMFLVVAAVIVVAFVMYVISRLCQSCTTFTKVTKRLSKEVLLTLILFNMLNFAYSAGLHFRYAPKEDPLYFMGTIVAICTLVIPVVMAVALLISEEQGFGQFKDKLKPGCVQRGYFVVTIVYRMGIGLYMASANENPLSTLIILAFSILFLVYNLVNLPFTKAYHNYRANICHLTQFVILFVAMYYRSMKSTTSATQTSSIFSLVYLEYILIIASLVASLIVLVYQIYLYIKQCCSKKKDQEGKENQDQNMPNQSMNKLNQRDITIIKVQDIQKVNTRVETLGPIYDDYS